MAKAKPLEKYIYDIPGKERLNLCRILDAEESWFELGAQMNVDRITLALIGKAVQRRQSPTDELLTKLGDKNITINRLFKKLYEIEQYRAMKILKPFVDEKYLVLLRDDINNSETIEFSQKSFNLTSKQFLTDSDYLEKSDHWKIKFKLDSNNLNNKFSSSVTKLQNSNYYDRRNSAEKLVSYHSAEVTRNSDSKILNKESKLNSLSQSAYEKSIPKEDTHKLPTTNKKSENSSESANFEYHKKEKDDKALQKEGKLPHNISKKHKTAASEFSSLEEALPSISIKQVSYIDIVKSTNNFSSEKILGQGGFGIVYKGELWKIPVAIKRLKPKNDHNKISKEEVSIKQSLNELKFLNCARIDNILPLYGVSLDGQEPCLVYQYMDNGSLEDRLRCKNGTAPLTWFQRSFIAIGTAKGLNYLHTADKVPLIHGDIKSANILLDTNFNPKIGDFGLTREGPLENRTHTKVTTVHGTQPYLPLEYLKYHKLSTKVDIYSYGIVLLEMATGQRAYDQKREKKLLVDYAMQCVAENLGEKIIDKKAGDEGIPWFNMFLDRGLKCTSKNKSERPEMAQVLDHFKEFENAVEKLRRSSNDFNHPPNLNQLSPLDLQLVHDIFREQIQPDKKQSPIQIDFSKLQLPKMENMVVRGPPASDNINISDIKAPPGDNFLEKKCFLSPLKQQQNSSMAVIVNTNHSNSCQAEFPANGNVVFTSNPSLPLVTILNQQGNVTNELGSAPSGSCVLSDMNFSDKIVNAENTSDSNVKNFQTSQAIGDDVDNEEENYSKSNLNINE